VHDTDPFRSACRQVDAGADPHVEAAAIVASMTDDEVLACLDGDTPFWPGLFDMTSGGYYRHTWPAAVVERLGVPGIRFADGPRGCVVGHATAFPVSMARGATFDPALEERVGRAIGAELRASGATFTGAVCLNLLRHPAWGRAQETYGEDPHHVGEMAAALTRGLQEHVLACMKHFALNSMENARFRVDVSIDERALHEVYLPHFRRVATEGVAATMSAYNSVNGDWCGEHEILLTDILRDEWGWDGMVVSDFIFGLRDAVASVRAGLDVEMPFRQQRAMRLPAALADGSIARAELEAPATRVVATLLRFHHLLDRIPDPAVIACDDHRALAREVAVASTVLLRNATAILPLDPASLRRVAVLGRLAAVANLGDGGSSDVHPPEVVTPLDGLRAALVGVEVVHADRDSDVAVDADVVIVVVGCTKADEGEYVDPEGTAPLIESLFPPLDHPELGVGAAPAPVVETGAGGPAVVEEPATMAPGGDRRSLRLSSDDERLIASARAVNPRCVVVVQAGSAVVMPWADDAAAVLLTWYPGMHGGHALADVLLGRAEPGGRLPFAVPRDEHDLVTFDPDATSVVYDGLHGQWLLDANEVAPHFGFGHGLGYTTFDLGEVGWQDGVVRATVANTGVLVHASVEASTVERPPRRLVGFRRIHLAAGEQTTIELAPDLTQLDVRVDGGWWREPGTYRFDVGLDGIHGGSVGVTVPSDRLGG
jgi:beta-glucosidase